MGAVEEDPIFGRIMNNQRYNVGQVGLLFVYSQLQTWTPTGDKHVQIVQPLEGLGKRSARFRRFGPSDKLKRCSIVFRGIGKRISRLERAA